MPARAVRCGVMRRGWPGALLQPGSPGRAVGTVRLLKKVRQPQCTGWRSGSADVGRAHGWVDLGRPTHDTEPLRLVRHGLALVAGEGPERRERHVEASAALGGAPHADDIDPGQDHARRAERRPDLRAVRGVGPAARGRGPAGTGRTGATSRTAGLGWAAVSASTSASSTLPSRPSTATGTVASGRSCAAAARFVPRNPAMSASEAGGEPQVGACTGWSRRRRRPVGPASRGSART